MSNTLDSVELIGRLFAAVCKGRPLDAVAGEQLRVAILQAVRNGTGLDSAIGLSGAGVRRARTRLLAIRRDLHLVEAVRSVALDDAVTDWERCRRLSPLLNRFMSDTWLHVAKLTTPHAEWPTWKIEAFRAAQTGLDLPRSATRLHQLLQRTPRYSLENAGAIVLSSYL